MVQFKSSAVVAFFLISRAFAAPQTETWEVDAAHSSVQFAVRYMMISNVRGEFTKFSGKVYADGKDIAKARVEVTIDAASIDTRNEGRDKHLRSAEFFDVATYPTLEFKSKRIEPLAPGRFRLVGDLTMHGATREVALNVEGPSPEMKDAKGTVRVGLSASAALNRKDFNMLWNRALDGGGVVVSDEVSITIDLQLIRRPVPTAAHVD